MNKISAFAPASTSNLAVGFDILGMAVNELGDKVTLALRDDNKLIIEAINNDIIPRQADKNTATMAINAMRQHFGFEQGLSVWIEKGIPLGSGLGGSAASSVAACLAMSQLIEQEITLEQLAQFALHAEAKVSGGLHGDNVIPSLFGGFTLIQSLHPLQIIQLPIPEKLCAVFIHPHMTIETKTARQLLKPQVDLSSCIKQTANLAGFIASLYNNDLNLLAQSCRDHLIEPMRKSLIPNFDTVQQAALDNGALACSLSGSGPTLFAFSTKENSESVTKAMQEQFSLNGLKSDAWLSTLSAQSTQGAAIL